MAAQNEFPVFGLAEVMLRATEEKLVEGWREAPEQSTELTAAFHGISLRWLKGAEAMYAITQRMLAAKAVHDRETKARRGRKGKP